MNARDFKFRPGNRKREVTAARLEALRQGVVANTPSPKHVGCKVRQTRDGFTIEVPPPPRAPQLTHPFQIVAVDVDKIKVRYGTINGEVPEIDDDELEPNLEDSPELEIDVSSEGVRRVFIRVELDSETFLIDSLTIEEAATLPADTATVGHFLINTVNVGPDETIIGLGTTQIKNNLNYAFLGVSAGTPNHSVWIAS